jgi:site-specific recombinase XerD
MASKRTSGLKSFGKLPYLYLKSGTYYYGPPVKGGARKWIRLGRTPEEAIVEYNKLVGLTLTDGISLSDMLDDFMLDHANRMSLAKLNPKLKAIKSSTFADYEVCVIRLKGYFENIPVSVVDELMVHEYMEKRIQKTGFGATRGNRELSLLSAAFQWAKLKKKWRPFVAINPCVQVPRYAESPREVYVSNETLREVLRDQLLSDSVKQVVRLLHITSQRVGDLLASKLSDIKTVNGQKILSIKQSKTGQLCEVAVTGPLQALIEDRLKVTSAKVDNILINEQGVEMTYTNLQSQWQRFRQKKRTQEKPINFTLHDIRGKSATDAFHTGRTLADVQGLLGHRNASTTDRYLKSVKQKVSQPVCLPIDELSDE